ncbi:MAG: VanZ family protein [Candidatus Theseobacter exili]|nr:VanZ family protein [Candidatus Theseobacter exili]
MFADHPWRVVFVWVGIILLFSSIPVSYPYKNGTIFKVDKIAHFTEYLILAFLVYHALFSSISGIKGKWIIILTIAGCFIFGGLDELHQSWITYRSSDIYDFISNVCGVVSGSFIAKRVYRLQVR